VLKSVYNYLSKLNYETFTNVIKTKIGLFFSGFIGGGSGIGTYFFLNASSDSLVVIKTIGTIMIAFITGAATALGKGWIEDMKKEKERKRLKDEQPPHKQIWGKNGTHN